MSEAVLSLGSNIGCKKENLSNAISAINMLHNTNVLKVSNFYVTTPFEVPDKQDDYLNCCVKIETDLLPETLLGACLGIESALKRVRTYKGAARIIDIDLILYEDVKINTKDLMLPHPRLFKRAFVLVPLRDLYPKEITPSFNFKNELKDVLEDSEDEIKIYFNKE